jgi:hypothetical protein
MGKRGLRVAVLALLCAAVGSATALGAGPDPGLAQGGTGLRFGKVLYVAIPADGQTVVQRIERSSGRVLRQVMVSGSFGLPRVAFDGTIEGLAADGRTLVLGQTRNVQFRKSSSFAVIDTPALRLRKVIKLRGDFTFDALAPRGQTLYLIEHVAAQDALRYRVRAYDLAAGLLLSKMVTDKRRWQSVMQGIPLARAHSADKRWAFTLYGGGSSLFVHSLDTREAYAVCIDLPQRLARLDMGKVRMKMQGEGRLVIRYGSAGKTLAVLDTRKFRVLSAVRNP